VQSEHEANQLSDADYRRLLDFRNALRRFLHWSEQAAETAGLSPAQHQLLLVVRGSPEPWGPTIGDIAEQLLVRHNSAVELIDRAEAAGLVQRHRDRDDHRIVRIRLTVRGSNKIQRLSATHLEELASLSGALPDLSPTRPT
jgi:DNA-binding MarR family transcriptional regulator